MAEALYLDNYEQILQRGLVKVCAGAGLLEEGELTRCYDADTRWEAFLKDYTADAVENFNSYPEAALSWAAFLGLAVAHQWDEGWPRFCTRDYKDYYGSRGWDDMDEHVLRDVLHLPLASPQAKKISDTLLSCATATLGLIAHEQIETQTELGFYVLVRSYTVLYRIGIAIELRRLGYKKVPIAPAGH